jgi:hypothetical protein
MKNFLKSIWRLITNPNPLFMMICVLLAGFSAYGQFLTGYTFLYVLAGIFMSYPVIWTIIGMIFAIKNSFKK